MKRALLLIVVPALLVALGFAQTPAAGVKTDQTTIKGCLSGSDGNYTVAEDNTGHIFKITTSIVDLKPHLAHDVTLIGHKASGVSAGAAAESFAVTELNMISEHCAAAAAAPAATVSTPAENSIAPAAAAPAATVSTPAETVVAPAPAVAAVAPAATVSTPAETVVTPAPAVTAAAPAATVSAPAETVVAPAPAVTAAAPAVTVSAPAETVVAPAPAPAVAAPVAHPTQMAARHRKMPAAPAEVAAVPAATTPAPVAADTTPAVTPSTPAATASAPTEVAPTPVATQKSGSLWLLILLGVVVIVLGTMAPVYSKWRKRKNLERTGAENLSLTPVAGSDQTKPDQPRKVA